MTDKLETMSAIRWFLSLNKIDCDALGDDGVMFELLQHDVAALIAERDEMRELLREMGMVS